MAEPQPLHSQLERGYVRALGSYLRGGGEAPLQQAYELGREGLTEGGGVLDMASMHHAALATILRERSGHGLPLETLEKAGQFFAESMSAYEMSHRAVGEANSALRRLNETLEEEVQRIAQALHDDAGQLIVAVHLSLEDAMRGLPADVRARMEGVKALLGKVEECIRDLSHELRPAMLDHLGLVPAVEFLAATFGQRTGLRITVQSTLNDRLPPKLAIAFYRIVQEALTNVRRHAGASKVRISIGKRGAWVRCLITDNGVGFDPASTVQAGRPGLGLLGIRERLNAVGGNLRIQSAEGRGTKLEISAPLQLVQQVDHADSDSARRRPSRRS